MGADLLTRTIFLPAYALLDLTAAQVAATDLAAHATDADMESLMDEGWITADFGKSEDRRPSRHTLIERFLHQRLGTIAASLTGRDVNLFYLSHNGQRTVDAYVTGGPSWGDAPTVSYHIWDLIFSDNPMLPTGWSDRLASAAGLLVSGAANAPVAATATFHLWTRS